MGVILLVCVMFLIETLSGIFETAFNDLSQKMIIFESKKNTMRQIKKAPKYPKL